MRTGFILYILYLFLYPERKIKKSKGDEYKPRRLLGMAVGAARGLVCAVLTVSFVTSTYFVLSGGISTNEKAAKIELFDNLSSTPPLDLYSLENNFLQRLHISGENCISIAIEFISNGVSYEEYKKICSLTNTGKEISFEC